MAQGRAINSSTSQCSFVANGGQNIIYFTEFSWELNEMMYLKHLTLRLTYSKWTKLGQCCYLYWYLFLNLWFFIVNYVSRLSNICFSNIDEDWSIKRSNKEPAWMAMRKRHDQKVILEAASVPSIWTDYFSAQPDSIINTTSEQQMRCLVCHTHLYEFNMLWVLSTFFYPQFSNNISSWYCNNFVNKIWP